MTNTHTKRMFEKALVDRAVFFESVSEGHMELLTITKFRKLDLTENQEDEIMANYKIQNAEELLTIGSTKVMAQFVKDTGTNKVEAFVFCRNEKGDTIPFPIKKSNIISGSSKLESELKDLDLNIDYDMIEQAKKTLSKLLKTAKKVVIKRLNVTEMRQALLNELDEQYQALGKDNTKIFDKPTEIGCTREVLKKIAHTYGWEVKTLIDVFERAGWLITQSGRKQYAINGSTRAYMFYKEDCEPAEREVA